MARAICRALVQHIPQMKQSHSPARHARDQSRSGTAHHSNPEAASTGMRAAELARKTKLAAEDLGQTQMEKAQSWPLLLTMHRGADEAPATSLGC